MSKISFIVNTYNDPLRLMCCLASLKLQGDHEIIVCDNSDEPDCVDKIKHLCSELKARRYRTKFNGKSACYLAIHAVAKYATGDWLCFPSSDGYYVPEFATLMLDAADRYKAGLVYCDCLYDPRLHGRGLYSVLHTVPEMCWIDKTCMLIRADLFTGFPEQENDWRDGALAEQLIRRGVVHAKAKGVLVVHN